MMISSRDTPKWAFDKKTAAERREAPRNWDSILDKKISILLPGQSRGPWRRNLDPKPVFIWVVLR